MPGMAQRAAQDFGFVLDRSFVIGDNVCDIEMGQAVDATTLLVRTGYGDGVSSAGKVTPDYLVDDLSEAAQTIRQLLERETSQL